MPVINIIACPIAFSIAAGVTEGKNVKDIQASFDDGIKEIDYAQSERSERSASL